MIEAPEAPAYLETLLLVLDLWGVFFFAVSGCLLAARRQFDIIGSVFLAFLAGLGGGVVRDLIIDDGVPNAFANPLYLIPPAVAAALVYFRLITQGRLRRTLLVFDAAGLALFCVTGTRTALSAGIEPIMAILLGVATGVVGGLLRDVVANEVPEIFNRHGLYAVPALLGAGLSSLLWTLDVFNWLTAALVMMAVFAFRLISLRRRWMAPNAARSTEP
ncbi:trimeric intracellular cation channel family protein [Citricoccus sp. K5]|uniref:trimeric intracellular cation channel family protein n=1 Tax=Citricoccus sp. K5 TaxID=2653135 RepID=UPI0012F261FD|nr:TRIC cation channel family protein [Citricoccus sp. K5]VXB86405.1 Putative membrane protein YeiH [Citricoccus sp. K5]